MSDREKAVQRVLKLRAMTVERGATPAEAASAARRADRLVSRFDLVASDLAPGASAPAPAMPASGHFGMPPGSVFIILNGVPMVVAQGQPIAFTMRHATTTTGTGWTTWQ